MKGEQLIKMNRLQLFLVCLACSLTSGVLSAQTTVSTIPEGYVSFSLPATGQGQNSVTYLSLPLMSDPVYSGGITSVTANSIIVATTPWTAGAFSTAAAPYFVKFLTGAETGRIIKVTANTTNSLTLDTTDNSSQTVDLTTSGFSVQAGDTFQVFPGDTLASLFGTNITENLLILVGGTSAFTSDTVGIYSPYTFLWLGYYFDTKSGFWKQSGSTLNANNTVLYPDAALTITRRQNEPALTFTLTGRVPEVSLLTKTIGNNHVLYNGLRYPIDLKLSQLPLGSNWAHSSSPFTADTISIWDQPALRWDTYYQSSTTSTWLKSDSTTDQSNFVIPAGYPIATLKRAVVSGATSFISSPLPYSLN